jgi:hypothetical protein
MRNAIFPAAAAIAAHARRTLLVGALALTGLAVSACGGGGSSSGNSAPADSSAARFTVSPALLDFGKTVIGKTVVGTLEITNAGTQSLDLTVTTPGAGFALGQPCGTLAPGAKCALRVEFTPTEQRAYTSSLDISAGTLKLSPDLRGTGQGLNVEVTSVADRCEDSTFLVSLSVTDARGEPILGLRADQVTAFINGTSANMLADLEVVTDRQTTAVGLVLDWSSSLIDWRQDIVDSTRVFIDSLGLEEGGLIDRAGVFRFSNVIDPNAQSFVNADAAGRATLNDALTRPFGGADTGSFIWGATNAVLTQVAAQANPLRTIVLLSDGRNSAGDVPLADLIASAQQQQIRVFTIGYGNLNPGPLRRLAEETGGAFFADPDAQALMQTFERISSVLTNQYRALYANPSPQTSNEFRIVVRDDADLEGEDSVTIRSCSG